MTATAPALSGSGLAQKTAQGFVWLAAGRLCTVSFSLTLGVLMARILTPADFGLFGMATICLALVNLLSDFGLSAAVVQKQNASADELSSIFWFNAALSTAIAAGMALVSPLVANVYRQPALAPVLQVLSLSIVLNGLGNMQRGLCQRSLEFGTLTRVSVGSALFAGISGVAAAGAGAGVWALVIQSLFASACQTSALWFLSHWRPLMHCQWSELRSLWRFSANLLGFQLLNYFSRNADNALIGWWLGPAQLGYYNLAYTLMRYPIDHLTSIAQQALFPSFARLQNEAAGLSAAYTASCRYLAFAIMPTMAGLAVVSGDLVVFLYGEKWADAARVVTILSVVACFQPFVSLIGVVFVARGFTGWFFRWSLVVSPVMVLAFAAGLRGGITGVALSYLIAQVLTTAIGGPLLLRKAEVNGRDLWRAVSIPAAATAGMVGVVLTFRHFLISADMRSVSGNLGWSVVAGLGAYSLILFLLRHHFLPQMRSDWNRVWRRN
jgi:O-antigen/teichoic acid export membrane protein